MFLYSKKLNMMFINLLRYLMKYKEYFIEYFVHNIWNHWKIHSEKDNRCPSLQACQNIWLVIYYVCIKWYPMKVISCTCKVTSIIFWYAFVSQYLCRWDPNTFWCKCAIWTLYRLNFDNVCIWLLIICRNIFIQVNWHLQYLSTSSITISIYILWN